MANKITQEKDKKNREDWKKFKRQLKKDLAGLTNMYKETLPERIKNIDVVRWQDGLIYVFGRSHRGFYRDEVGNSFNPDLSPLSLDGYLHRIVHDAKTGEIIEEDSFRYKNTKDIFLAMGLSVIGIGIPWLIHEIRPSTLKRGRHSDKYIEMVHKFRSENVADLIEAVKDIKIYQGSLDELAQETERELERVDPSRPETFIEAKTPFWVRVKAHDLRADAVVHYQPGSSIGTPVKFKGE